jgi:ATP-dependent 26S proteasome regulatory subunit
MLEIVNQLDGFDSRGNIKVSMPTFTASFGYGVFMACSS